MNGEAKMAIDLLKTQPTKATKSQVKINTVEDARRAIISGLKGQKEIWNDKRGEDLPRNAKEAKAVNWKGETKSSLWFKKKDDNDDYLLCIKCGITKLGAEKPNWSERTDKSGKITRINTNNDYYWTVPQDQMTSTIDQLIKQVEEGLWDQRIRWAMPKVK